MSQTITTPRKRHFRIKPGTVLSLGLFLIVLISLAIYFRPPKPLVPSVDRESGMMFEVIDVPTVLELRADDLDKITFQRGDVAFELERIDGVWHITQPFFDRADDEDVAMLVDNLAGIAYDELLEEAGPDAEFGLDAPIITATFTDNSGQTYSMAIGQPEGSVEWFVETSEVGTPYLVRNLPDFPFNVLAGELIYGPMLNFSPADVVRITAIADGEERVLEAEGDSWFTDTEEGRALVFNVNTFLRDLHALVASSIAATEAEAAWERLGLEPIGQTMHIALELKDGSVHTLDVGGTTPDGRRFYVRSSDRPHAYIVVEFSALNLDRKLAQATTDVLSVNLDRVVQIEVVSVNEEGTVVERSFNRDAQNKLMWQSERRVAFYVSSLLETVNGVTAFQVAPEASAATYGFNPSPGSLTLRLRMENRAVNTLEIGSTTPDGRYVYVRSNMRPGVYLASVDAANAIRTGLGVIRTDLLPFDRDRVTAIEIANVGSTAGQADVYRLTRSGDQWTRDGAAVDANAVNTLLNNLRSLQAEKIPPIVPEEEYRFYPAANSTRVTIQSDDGSELIMDIGASVQEGVGWFSTTSYYVRISDLEEVVHISERSQRDVRNAINAVTR